MRINTILFDLDGTLLPMDQNEFTDIYFAELIKACAEGYDPKLFVKGIWAGTMAMVENDGSMTNRERFMKVFASLLGEEVRLREQRFDRFYANEFELAKRAVRQNPVILEFVELLKRKGYALALATNPVFPLVATLARIRWANLRAEDFMVITTYENSRFCKPNPNYFLCDVLGKIGKRPEECLMVGNDVEADMGAGALGMETYLITNCLENPNEVDISKYRHGRYEDFLEFVKGLPEA